MCTIKYHVSPREGTISLKKPILLKGYKNLVPGNIH